MPAKSSILSSIAKKHLESLTSAEQFENESLYDFIVRISPKYSKPYHLSSIIDELEKVELEPIRLAYSMPPRHSKTETISHFMARFLRRHPDKTIAYCTYSGPIAEEKSRGIQRYFLEAGGTIDPSKKGAARWLTDKGGGMIAVGVGGPLTSLGVDLLVVDDPHRNRAEAESATIRENTFGWLQSTALTRMEPGSSAICLHTRWHADDVIGRLNTGDWGEWDYKNLPAISDTGAPLWPERWPLEELLTRKKAVGDYEWAALFMGQPRPRGSGIFNNASLYRTESDTDPRYAHLPTLPRITATCIGIDLAYTDKTYSDYSVAVVLGRGDDNRYYVLDVLRRQCEAPAFAAELKRLCVTYGTKNTFMYIGGVEKGVLSFMKNSGLYIKSEVTNKDKFTRSLESSAAWNRGDILIPRDAPWLHTFTGEVLAFTGVSDKHDDQVDAMAAAYSQIGAKSTVRILGKKPLLPY